MNDAEIEAAILARHRDRVTEDEGNEGLASLTDEAMEEPIEEHFGLQLQDDKDQVLLIWQLHCHYKA